jgi:hypothetical protein
MSRNFVIFRVTKFREIKNYFAKYDINISRQKNFVDHLSEYIIKVEREEIPTKS